MPTDYYSLLSGLSGNREDNEPIDYFRLMSSTMPSVTSDIDYFSLMGGRAASDPGANERALGYLPAGHPEFREPPDPGFLGMAIEGFKEGLGGPIVGLAERANMAKEGSRQKIREDFEEARLGYLSGGPNALRATVAGLSELGGSIAPIVPAGAAARAVGGLAGRAGMSLSRPAATALATSAEGALMGLGETAGQGATSTALGVGLGLAGGALAARPILRSKALSAFDDSLADMDRVYQKYIVSGGHMGKFASERTQEAWGRVNERVFTARYNAEQVQKVIDDYATVRGLDPEEVSKEVNRAMSPLDAEFKIGHLPEELQAPVRVWRDHIDGLSDEIMKSEHLTDEMRKIIRENKGLYGHVSHKAFDDPSHAKHILETDEGREKWARMQEFLENETDLTPDEITARMELMLEEPFNAMEIIGTRTKGVGKLDQSIYKHRKDLNPTIREFLGIYDDPYVNYLKTVSKMSVNIELDRAFRDIADDLVASGRAVWAVRPTGEFKYDIKGGRPPMSGDAETGQRLFLKDLDQRDAFVNAQANMGGHVFQFVNGFTKLMKTVGSPQTHARNWMSGHLMLMLQGHLATGNREIFRVVRKGAKARFFADNMLDDIDTGDAMLAYRELLKRNVVGEGTMAGELQHFLEESRSLMKQGAQPRFLKFLEKGGRFSTFAKKVANNYRAEDDFWKVTLFLKEKKRYARALPNAGEDEINKIAADIVNETMQIYSKIPQAVRNIRDFPLAGPFISFPAEIIRNVKNTGKLAIREMKSDNAAIRKIGHVRLAGMAATLGAVPTSLSMLGNFITGTDSSVVSALRSFMPPWSENSQVMMVPGGNRERQEYHFVDFSFMDPYNYVKKPFRAFHRALSMDDISGAEKILDTFDEGLDPITSPEIFFSEALSYVDDLAKSRMSSPSSKLKKAAYRLYRAFAPGGVLIGERILRGADIKGVREVLPSSTKYGKQYNLFDEVLAVGGPRVSTISVPQSFQNKSREYMASRRQAVINYNVEKKNRNSRSAYRLMNAKKESEETNERASQQMLRIIEDARTVGMDNQAILKALQAGGVSRENAMHLIRGRVPPIKYN